jgi:MarR family transcriptional regulator, transcriptional regulator for hemolysin
MVWRSEVRGPVGMRSGRVGSSPGSETRHGRRYREASRTDSGGRQACRGMMGARDILQHDFEASIGYWICLAAHSIQRALDEELAPHGVTFRQSQVLAWLALEGELSQVELAAKLMIEPPTLVKVLDRMERDEWITRTPCRVDRRRKIIRPNERAGEVWSKIAECALRVRRQASTGMTEEEIETLIGLLRRVLSNLGARTPEVTAPKPAM